MESYISKASFAAVVQGKLAELAMCNTPVEITHGTHLGKPAVYFNAQDYFVNLAESCKFTIVGKFFKGKPTMEEIRKSLATKFHLKDSVKVAYFNPQHVYLDFTNETDYNHILSKSWIHIGDTPTKILTWSPDFKPEVETSIASVWILIHKLPWHLFRWDIVSRILNAVGTAAAPDQATYSKSRGNVAKLRLK